MFQRCCSLASAARPVAANLLARFVQRGDGPRRCASRGLESSVERASFKQSVTSGRVTVSNGDRALEPRPNLDLDTRINAASFACEENLDDGDVEPPRALDVCNEDLSDIGAPLTPTFSFAKYANKSETIQELVKLGVGLYRFEGRPGMVQFILDLDYKRDVMPYIRFLHDCGVPADRLGAFLTKNPYIFKVNLDDLHTRIRYLRAHKFSRPMIQLIVCGNPNWLSHSTKDIDNRLGYFQTNFKLKGNEVRLLTAKGPKVVTYRMTHLLENTFSIKEEMGLEPEQVKRLLLQLPRIWIKNRDRLMSSFDYACNVMQLPRDIIVKQPQVLLCRKTRLEQRHLFLVKLNKAQYDPSKPMYVAPLTLIGGTDLDFCRGVAQTSIEVYNAFLKTF